MAELSQRVQDTIIMLVTALWASRQKDEATVAAADILCQDLRRKLTGKRPTDRYFRDAGRLADMIISGGFERIAGRRRRRSCGRIKTKQTPFSRNPAGMRGRARSATSFTRRRPRPSHAPSSPIPV